MSKPPLLTETEEFVIYLCDKYGKKYSNNEELVNNIDDMIYRLNRLEKIIRKGTMHQIYLKIGRLNNQEQRYEIYRYIESKLKN